MTNLIKIEEYQEIEEKLAEVREASNFIPDVTTKEGYDKSKRVSLDVGKLLTALEKKRKEKKKYFLEGGKAVDSQAKEIAAQLEEMQLPHKEAYKELDNLRKQREADRKQALEDRVAYIRNLPEEMKDSHSSEIKAAYDSVRTDECLDYYEFTEQALKARNSSTDALAKLLDVTLKAEEDAIELDKLRKQAAEREQKEREDKIARDAAEKAEREKAEAIAQAEKEKSAAAEREEKARIDAENAKRLQAEAEAEEDRKREANRAYVGKVRKEAKESLIALGLDEAMAKKVVLAINSGDVNHISIKY